MYRLHIHTTVAANAPESRDHNPKPRVKPGRGAGHSAGHGRDVEDLRGWFRCVLEGRLSRVVGATTVE